MRNFALLEKIKAGWRVRRGCCKTRKQLLAYYGFEHKHFKSNNIYPKCQIAVILFIMSPNSFKAPKSKILRGKSDKVRDDKRLAPGTGIKYVLEIQSSKGHYGGNEYNVMNQRPE